MSGRTPIRPYSTLKDAITGRWSTQAKDTRDNITVDANLGKGGAYDVKADITHQNGVASGAYNSSTGIHAEMDALSNCPPSYFATLEVNPPPCKRCAAVLYHYRRKFSWTIKAPSRTFASTYQGAYHVPDFVGTDVLLEDLVDGGIVSAAEAQYHKFAILADFAGGNW